MTTQRLPLVVALLAALTADTLGQGLDPAIERLRRNVGRDLVSQPWSAAQRELITWAYAVQEWLQESPNNPRANLARGVMLECLASPAHGTGFLNDMLRREDQEMCGARAGPQPRPGVLVVHYSSGMSVGGCRNAARSAYEKVLAKEPTNAEAQLRLGGLGARGFNPESQSGKDADAQLEKVAGLTKDRNLTFLASLFRGLVVEKRKDLAVARTRYEEARAINPEWPSARLALGSLLLQEGRTQPAKDLLSVDVRPDASDPWYGYGCRIMTPDVLSELREWQTRQRGR